MAVQARQQTTRRWHRSSWMQRRQAMRGGLPGRGRRRAWRRDQQQSSGRSGTMGERRRAGGGLGGARKEWALAGWRRRKEVGRGRRARRFSDGEVLGIVRTEGIGTASERGEGSGAWGSCPLLLLGGGGGERRTSEEP